MSPLRDSDAPLISVGVPAYDAEAFVVPALGSLLAQDLRSPEVVVPDNGSTDATERLCRELAARDGAYHVPAGNGACPAAGSPQPVLVMAGAAASEPTAGARTPAWS